MLNAGAGGIPPEFAAFFGGGPVIPGVGQNTTPMAGKQTLSEWDPDSSSDKPKTAGPGDELAAFRLMAQAFGIGGETAPPRVVMRFPSNPAEMLLSGTLAGGQALSNRAQLIDAPMGKGHAVMFAIRPFWRWQTQGTYFLGFNAILNWNDLDAGRADPATSTTGAKP